MSRRMDAILQHLRAGGPLYDLCCDHGQIGLKALHGNFSSHVTFVDQSDAALESLRIAVAQMDPSLRARCEILCGAAESCVSDVPSADFVIAGVGIQTTISIIDSLFPVSLGEHRLILAPQQKSLPLRNYLKAKGFGLKEEGVVRERGRFREIIVIEQRGEAIDCFGSRIAKRQDEDSVGFVQELRTYYQKLKRTSTEAVSDQASDSRDYLPAAGAGVSVPAGAEVAASVAGAVLSACFAFLPCFAFL